MKIKHQAIIQVTLIHYFTPRASENSNSELFSLALSYKNFSWPRRKYCPEQIKLLL